MVAAADPVELVVAAVPVVVHGAIHQLMDVVDLLVMLVSIVAHQTQILDLVEMVVLEKNFLIEEDLLMLIMVIVQEAPAAVAAAVVAAAAAAASAPPPPPSAMARPAPR